MFSFIPQWLTAELSCWCFIALWESTVFKNAFKSASYSGFWIKKKKAFDFSKMHNTSPCLLITICSNLFGLTLKKKKKADVFHTFPPLLCQTIREYNYLGWNSGLPPEATSTAPWLEARGGLASAQSAGTCWQIRPVTQRKCAGKEYTVSGKMAAVSCIFINDMEKEVHRKMPYCSVVVCFCKGPV